MYADHVKRALDLAIAIPALLLVGPVILILMAIASLDGGRPIFGQLRVGRHGQMFTCYKIRSMVVDAQARLEDLLRNDPAAAAEWKENQKLENDPRITAFGRFIRRTSLDELPQLWNIIRGDMSIVGPRPVLKDELKRYGESALAYISIRPGLTGLWQTSGRNDVSYDERVSLDVKYSRILSLRTDIKLMFATALSVAHLTGK